MAQQTLEERQQIAEDLIKGLEWGNVMESMQGDKLRDRIQFGASFPIPHIPTPVPYLGNVDETVDYIFYEMIAACPVTGILDIYKVIVRYIPEKVIPELKSFKLYLQDFGKYKVPISHEHLAAKIHNEFKGFIDPKKLYVEVQTSEKGEICTTLRVGDLELATLEEKPFRRN